MDWLPRRLACKAAALAHHAKELAPVPPTNVPPTDEIREGLDRLRKEMWWAERQRGYPEIGSTREHRSWTRA